VHNDFHVTRGIFPIFDGLEVKDIDKPLHSPNVDVPTTNGHSADGSRGTNGTNGETKEAHGKEKEDPNLLHAAKAGAVEVTNGTNGTEVKN
jgi:methylenetetrahydrofolate reductase (NADPH)